PVSGSIATRRSTSKTGKATPTATSTSSGGNLPLSRSGSLDRNIFLIRLPPLSRRHPAGPCATSHHSALFPTHLCEGRRRLRRADRRRSFRPGSGGGRNEQQSREDHNSGL